MEYAFLPEHGKPHTQGRTFYDQGKLHLTWIGCSAEFAFKGADRAVISFDKYDWVTEGYIKINVNGKDQVHAISNGTENIIVLTDEDSQTDLKITRITEGPKDMVISGINLYGGAPELVKKPHTEKKLIEFIGDSLSCGYGNQGAETTKIYHSYEQDCTLAYTCQTAAMLDCDYSIIAMSGKGVSHNWDGSTDYMIPEFYSYRSRETTDEWDFSVQKPDIIVINAGTNDAVSKTPVKEITDAARKFVKFVREKNPKAQIVYAYGFSDYRNCAELKALVNEMAESDDKLCFFEFGDFYSKPEEKGANGHPSVFSHFEAAKELTVFIKNKIIGE